MSDDVITILLGILLLITGLFSIIKKQVVAEIYKVFFPVGSQLAWINYAVIVGIIGCIIGIRLIYIGLRAYLVG